MIHRTTLKPSLQSRRPAIAGFFSGVYLGSPWMTVTGWIMLADIVVSIIGLVLDPATVDGNPAWVKPLKFAVSTAIFSFTIAFILAQMKAQTKTVRLVAALGRIMAVFLVLEIALIDMQAARHTTSHFNIATRFDAGVYAAMGFCIAMVMLCTILMLAMCLRQSFADRGLASAIRLGLLSALIGMSTGVLMTLPTPQQQAAARQGIPPRNGAHTVGAPDTGAASGAHMPLVGWSADHGDLRIAHFIGLHCMQAVLLAWGLTLRRPGWTFRRQIYLVRAIAWSFFGLFAITLWQALRGQPLFRPDSLMWLGWGIWLVAAVAGFLPVFFVRSSNSGSGAAMESAQ